MASTPEEEKPKEPPLSPLLSYLKELTSGSNTIDLVIKKESSGRIFTTSGKAIKNDALGKNAKNYLHLNQEGLPEENARSQYLKFRPPITVEMVQGINKEFKNWEDDLTQDPGWQKFWTDQMNIIAKRDHLSAEQKKMKEHALKEQVLNAYRFVVMSRITTLGMSTNRPEAPAKPNVDTEIKQESDRKAQTDLQEKEKEYQEKFQKYLSYEKELKVQGDMLQAINVAGYKLKIGGGDKPIRGEGVTETKDRKDFSQQTFDQLKNGMLQDVKNDLMPQKTHFSKTGVLDPKKYAEYFSGRYQFYVIENHKVCEYFGNQTIIQMFRDTISKDPTLPSALNGVLQERLNKLNKDVAAQLKSGENLSDIVNSFAKATADLQNSIEYLTNVEGNHAVLQGYVTDVFKALIKQHTPADVIYAMRMNADRIPRDMIDNLDVKLEQDISQMNTVLFGATRKFDPKAIENFDSRTFKSNHQIFSEFLLANPETYERLEQYLTKSHTQENMTFLVAVEGYLKNNKPTFTELNERFLAENAHERVNISSDYFNKIRTQAEAMAKLESAGKMTAEQHKKAREEIMQEPLRIAQGEIMKVLKDQHKNLLEKFKNSPQYTEYRPEYEKYDNVRNKMIYDKFKVKSTLVDKLGKLFSTPKTRGIPMRDRMALGLGFAERQRALKTKPTVARPPLPGVTSTDVKQRVAEQEAKVAASNEQQARPVQPPSMPGPRMVTGTVKARRLQKEEEAKRNAAGTVVQSGQTAAETIKPATVSSAERKETKESNAADLSARLAEQQRVRTDNQVPLASGATIPSESLTIHFHGRRTKKPEVTPTPAAPEVTPTPASKVQEVKEKKEPAEDKWEEPPTRPRSGPGRGSSN